MRRVRDRARRAWPAVDRTIAADHAGLAPSWAHWRTVEGGYLIDRRAVRELADAAGLVWSSGTDEEQLRYALSGLLDRGLERCPHGCPIGIDLALPDGGRALGLDLLAGPAMGSGCSPWTRALLVAVERHLPPASRVADVGTGSGILGLIALRAGAATADAVDVDRLAVAIARRNAGVNGLAARFDARVGSADRLDDGYDLAIVSLGAVAELDAVMAETVRRLRPGGTLIASPAQGATEAARLRAKIEGLGLWVVDAVEVEGWHVPVATAAG